MRTWKSRKHERRSQERVSALVRHGRNRAPDSARVGDPRATSVCPVWDGASIAPADDQFPLLHVEWHEGHGFVIQCYEDAEAWSDFLLTGARCGPPTVEINLGGQTLERWPSELFVSEEFAHQALDCFLTQGKQDPALHWVRIDAFPRETVWEGREEREAWERAKSAMTSNFNWSRRRVWNMRRGSVVTLGLGFTNRVDSKSRKFDVGRAENVPVIDVYAAFRDRETMFDDESHFRVEGHRVAAQLIYEALEGVLRR